MIEAHSVEKWQRIADFILPVLIGEPTTNGGTSHTHYWRAQAEYGLLTSDFPPGKWRTTYYTLAELIESGQAVHQVILDRALDGKVSGDDLLLWQAVYGQNSTLREGTFDSHVKSLKDAAERERLLATAREFEANIARGIERSALVPKLISDVASTGVEGMAGESATSLAAEFAAMMQVKPKYVLMTGIKQLDKWLGGLSPSSLITVVGRMKQRKTTLVLNALLNMARDGRSVSVMMFENNRRMITAHCVSMLAVEWLIENKLYGNGIIGSDGAPLDIISPEALYKFKGMIQDTWDAQRKQAVAEGAKRFAALGELFRIYDRSQKGGALSDCHSITRVALRDKRLYECDVMALDHVQRVQVPNARGDYEKMNVYSPYLEALAKEHEICLLALSQRTSDEDADGSYRSGSRGGNALDEAADHVITVGYRLKKKLGNRKNSPVSVLPDDELAISTHLSRWSKNVADKVHAIYIDPPSGLVLRGGEGHEVLW